MAVRNVARGGGKAFKGEVTGLKELERKLKALRTDNPTLITDLKALAKHSAEDVRDQMRVNAIGAGWASVRIHSKKAGEITGQEAIDSIFASAKGVEPNSRARINALAGVSKRRSMVEWNAGKYPRSPRAKVPAGGLVAESLAAMLEFGTTRMAARPAIRSAVAMAKERVINSFADGMNALLAKYSA